MQLYYRKTPTQVHSCEYCEIFKDTYFEEHLLTAASVTRNATSRLLKKNFLKEKPSCISQEKSANPSMFLSSKYCDTLYTFHIP